MTTETTPIASADTGVSAPATAEAQFQSLFDAGAFEPPKPEQARNDQGQAKAPEPEVAEQPKAEPEAPATPEAEQPAEETPEAEESYASLDDLLKAKGYDPEAARSLPVTVKIDGVEKQIPLSEVLKSYQLEGHVNNKSIQLSEQQKAFQAEQEAARQLVAQQLQQNQALGQLAMQELTNEFQKVDWAALRATNPAEFAARQMEFQQRQNQIQSYLGSVHQQQQAAEQQRQASLAEKLQSEQAAMFERHPEWKDPAAFASARDGMMNYAKQLGFSEAELSQVYDHRLMDILHDAASFRALQAAKPEALKQVRAAPKMGKPGTRNVTDPQQVARQSAIERFNANPRDQDAAAALFDFLAA